MDHAVGVMQEGRGKHTIWRRVRQHLQKRKAGAAGGVAWATAATAAEAIGSVAERLRVTRDGVHADAVSPRANRTDGASVGDTRWITEEARDEAAGASRRMYAETARRTSLVLQGLRARLPPALYIGRSSEDSGGSARKVRVEKVQGKFGADVFPHQKTISQSKQQPRHHFTVLEKNVGGEHLAGRVV